MPADNPYDPSTANGAAQQERRFTAFGAQPLPTPFGYSGLQAASLRIAERPRLVQQPRVAIRRGVLDAFSNVCERWQVTYPEQIVLLGYKGAEWLGTEVLSGSGPDVPPKDRIGYLTSISLGLGGLFREAIAPERIWLRASKAALRGKTPLGFMLEGRMENLIVVLDLVEKERGL